MTLRRKLLLGFLAAFLVLVGGCGIGLLALMPAGGPAMLRALPTDADVIAYAEDVDALWKALESSDDFDEFRRGPAWEAVLEAGLAEALEGLRASGLEPSRSKASHLVGREAGVALWLDPSGRLVTSWLAAFRIDTWARIAELAAGRLFLTESITRTEESGATVAELAQAGGGLHWTRLGDLLVVTAGRDLLVRAVREIDTRGDDTSFAGVFQSALEARRGSTRAGVRLGRPEGLIEILFGDVRGAARRRPVSLNRGGLTQALRALGLPAPVDRITIALRADQERPGSGGARVLEDTLLTSPLPLPAKGAPVEDICPPSRTFLWWRFRPGLESAAEYAWGVFARMRPPQDRARRLSTSGIDVFRNVVMPRVGTDVAMAFADQEVAAESAGFPAQYTFVGMKGAALVHAGLEPLLRARSLGVYSEGKRLPVRYPYVVRREAAGRPLYEMVIRYTRRSEGHRPSVAVRANDLVFCSSVVELQGLLAHAEGSRRPRSIFPELVSDEWLRPEGAGARDEVFRLEWRPPKDFQQLKNGYDYMTEFRRYRGSLQERIAGGTDYERLWRIARDVLARVRRHSRVGYDVPGGMRMRAVWDFAAEE